MIGLVLILLGILIRLVAIRHMGNFMFQIDHPNKIVTDGIYTYIRHPSYVGSFLVFIGLSIISLHAAFLYLVFAFYLSRVAQEESLLMNYTEYVDYVKRSGMFIPKLWRKK
jgi:protein-S-isoprenylcysteine O-methyltransferase Ste14